VGGGNS